VVDDRGPRCGAPGAVTAIFTEWDKHAVSTPRSRRRGTPPNLRPVTNADTANLRGPRHRESAGAPTGGGASGPRFRIRWSQLEAAKPLARPFGVLFHDDAGADCGGLAVSGEDLLFYSQFRVAVLQMLGLLFAEPRAEAADDVQRAWLDVLAEHLPAAVVTAIEPVDVHDPLYGRQHAFAVHLEEVAEEATPKLSAAVLLDYQLCQAALAHQSGRLLRVPWVEAEAEPPGRSAAWVEALRGWLRCAGGGPSGPGG